MLVCQIWWVYALLHELCTSIFSMNAAIYAQMVLKKSCKMKIVISDLEGHGKCWPPLLSLRKSWILVWKCANLVRFAYDKLFMSYCTTYRVCYDSVSLWFHWGLTLWSSLVKPDYGVHNYLESTWGCMGFPAALRPFSCPSCFFLSSLFLNNCTTEEIVFSVSDLLLGIDRINIHELSFSHVSQRCSKPSTCHCGLLCEKLSQIEQLENRQTWCSRVIALGRNNFWFLLRQISKPCFYLGFTLMTQRS